MAHIHGMHRSIINRYDTAVREDEMKGAKHPSEHADIEAELADARESLENLIVRLYEKKNRRKP